MTASTAAWCPTCADDATPDRDGMCPWCGTPVLPRKPVRRGKPAGVHGYLTDTQLRACHALYEQGHSTRTVAERIHPRTRYATVKSCANALLDGWRRLGLHTRDRAAATRLASTTHGLAPRGNVDPGHRHRMRVQRCEVQDAPCEAVRTQYPRRGEPCRRPALLGERFCHAHHPARRAARDEQLERMRARKGAA